uniref:hypothetical protein n=1 Tax=Gemmatimonas sp. TaxID=1962908 RepID=UPI00286D03D0
PALLPDGQTVLVSSGTVKSLMAIEIASGKVTEIGLAGTALGVVEGSLSYLSASGDLLAIAFDVGARKVRGEPVLPERNIYGVGLSRSGTLA